MSGQASLSRSLKSVGAPRAFCVQLEGGGRDRCDSGSDTDDSSDGDDGFSLALPESPFLTLADAFVLAQCSSVHALQLQRFIVKALVRAGVGRRAVSVDRCIVPLVGCPAGCCCISYCKSTNTGWQRLTPEFH